MLHFLPLDELEIRVKALGLNLGMLAEACGMHNTTVYAARKHRREMRGTNLVKLTRELHARERALLRHLVALHPDILEAPAPQPVDDRQMSMLDGAS